MFSLRLSFLFMKNDLVACGQRREGGYDPVKKVQAV